ncbi:MAG TPA: COQ9 family protein [Rhizomicrobium sp.]
MTTTPDKPEKKPRKKAVPKEAKTDEAAQPKAKKTDMPSDDALKEAVLKAALPHAAFDGFSDAVLEKAGREAGIEKADVLRLFEAGPISLIEFYSHWADAEMEKRLAAADLQAMKIRARIAAAVKARLTVLAPHKEAARRAAALLSLPMHAVLGAKLLYRTVDAMWRAAGDTSTDFNFYTKRGILAGVYGATAMRWFNDTSDDEKATDEFLAARIENVMQFEKFKAKAKEALANFPAFANFVKDKK